ncbi:MAG: segregation/condensation protein A [Verrucomicrobia bacterium]|nr:segregation/condensation protein A [Verrucomicrobiota bacterium]
MAEYKVQFEVFEGPLDLLLYLIKKEEVDIYEVNLTKLATQFIEYVDLMRQFDLEVAGEFLVMASTLMYIKSRELLPVDQQVAVEAEEEGEDPRWELIRQLVEYKKFKDAAAQLQVMEERQENVFPRLPGKIEFLSEAEPKKEQIGIFDLLNAVNAVLKRFQDKTAGQREIYEDKWTVSEKMEFVLKTITERTAVKFSELFAAAANRAEVVCTFLALLELIRLKQLACAQPEPFAEIEVTKAVAQAILPEHSSEPEPVPTPGAAAMADAADVDNGDGNETDAIAEVPNVAEAAEDTAGAEDADADDEDSEDEDEEDEYDEDEEDEDDEEEEDSDESLKKDPEAPEPPKS